jgi:AGCS family alanine or glycine:cation symporter
VAILPLFEESVWTCLEATVDGWAGAANRVLGPLLFASLGGVPFIVLWLAAGALVFTLWMRFINLRAFAHAWRCVRGDYDRADDPGEVSHRQALASALSGTVGLGNIAGVAIAVSTGGPGATFWMIVAGLLGMTLKFTECTLGQIHRKIDAEGRVSGGPMHYLADGLAARGLPRLGRLLATLFLVLCIFSSFGGGNLFQVSQSLSAVEECVPALRAAGGLYGAVLAAAVAGVILGGIRRIALATEAIVPLMCGSYLLLALVILARHWSELPAALLAILRGAFQPEAAYGGFLGVLVQGVRRAAFSNEAGVGSASIAHAAAKTDEPVREGLVALLEPFIDTVVVCTLTALVIVVTGAHANPDPAFAAARASDEGARLTSLALRAEFAFAPYLLAAVVVLFALSTVLTWSYYGERCVCLLVGERGALPYRLAAVAVTWLGALVAAGNAKDLSDYCLLSMSVPNLLGLYLLGPSVRRALDDYWQRFEKVRGPERRG